MAEGAGQQGASALHHLRQRGRRQVDPDRAAALRHQADLRRPAFGARSGQPEARHAGRRDRLRVAGRRPFRRARAGHHDRRRLSLLREREAQVHRRRHAGSRAVHAQHGHRRLDRRPGRASGRCAQGRADPDAAAFLSRPAARHPALRARRHQDGPGRFRPGRVRSDYCRLSRLCGPDRHQGLDGYSGLGAWRRQYRREEHADGLVRGPDVARATRQRSDRCDFGCCKAVPAARPVGEPARPVVPRICGADRSRVGEAGRRSPRASVGAADAGCPHRNPRRRPPRSDRGTVHHPHLRG